MSTQRKLVVILGATGAQGNPVAKYLLANSSHLFRVRAITRGATKPSAIELSSLGAEVVEADFSDSDSIERALSNANTIFAITNFWDQASYDLEVTQGKLINKLASEIPELEHYIFSSLPDGRQLDGGRFQNILPYNAKAAIRDDLKTYTSLWKKTTELWVAFYYQNWLKYNAVFGPQNDGSGTMVLSMPFPGSAKIPSSWADDVAPVVDTLLKSDSQYHGKTVALVGETVSQNEMLSLWSDKLNIKAVFEQVSGDDFQEKLKTSGLPDHLASAARELCEALVFETEVMGDENVVQGRDLLPSGYKQKSWNEYIAEEEWSSIL